MGRNWVPLTCGETGGRGGLTGTSVPSGTRPGPGWPEGGDGAGGAAGAAAVVTRGQALLQAPSLPRRGPAHGRGNRGTEMKNVPRVARGPDVAQHDPGGQAGPRGWFLGRPSPWPLLARPAALRDAHSPPAAWHPAPAPNWAGPAVHASPPPAQVPPSLLLFPEKSRQGFGLGRATPLPSAHSSPSPRGPLHWRL